MRRGMDSVKPETFPTDEGLSGGSSSAVAHELLKMTDCAWHSIILPV
jgi:hypothetical protein